MYNIAGAVYRYSEGVQINTDAYGNAVERSKHEHPYSYSPHVQWQADDKTLAWAKLANDKLCYTDTDKIMTSWTRCNSLMRKHFGNEGQYWTDRDPKAIEAFMRDWTECPDIVLLKVTDYCNASNGYPYWEMMWYNPGTQK